MKKIRLTEKNLQNLIGKVVKESQKVRSGRKYRLNEGKIEVWCECGKGEGCYGSWKGSGSVNCTCCGPLLKDNPGMVRPNPMDDVELDMAADIMRETYRRLKKSRR